jgi:hypothetical protein
MLKPTASFKLSKQTKRFMCTIRDPEQRNAFKRAMIQAELAALIQPKREKKPFVGKTEVTDSSAD